MLGRLTLVVLMTVGASGNGRAQQPAGDSLKYSSSSLRIYSTRQLIWFFSDSALSLNRAAWSQKGNHDRSTIGFELARRDAYLDLLEGYRVAEDPGQIGWIEAVLEHLRNRLTDSVMQTVAEVGGLDRKTFYALKYFATSGHRWALDSLNCHYYLYMVSSEEFSAVPGLFASNKYRQGAWNLVSSLDAASTDLAAAALDGLRKLFPEAPGIRRPLRLARQYWGEYVREHAPDVVKAEPGCVQAPLE